MKLDAVEEGRTSELSSIVDHECGLSPFTSLWHREAFSLSHVSVNHSHIDVHIENNTDGCVHAVILIDSDEQTLGCVLEIFTL